jgi:hypothetical protein
MITTALTRSLTADPTARFLAGAVKIDEAGERADRGVLR